MKIIAVDDEYHALNLLCSAIDEAMPGASVYPCSDADLAIEKAKEIIPDIAFLDIHMPKKDGIQLAKELKTINPKINIIFATGFSEYMKEGIDLRMSGYLFKPVTAEAVKTELENLRNPIEKAENKRISIVTFGNFEVFFDGEPVKFERKQAKEILAYLVDKRGTSVTYSELAAMLWEDSDYDRVKQKNLQVYIASLVKTFKSLGEDELIKKGRQGIMVNTAIVDCDYYRFLAGDTLVINSFAGQYMSAYSWAEFTTGYLESHSKI